MQLTPLCHKKHLKRQIALAVLLVALIAVATLFPAPASAVEETVRIGFCDYAAPYHFIGNDGTYQGMHIDMMNWIIRQKGLKAMYIPYQTNSACLEALNRGEVDVILGHRTNDSAAIGLQYTSELSSSSMSLIAPTALVEIAQRTANYKPYSAAIEYGSASAYAASMGVSGYLVRANQAAVFEALLLGQADMALCDYDCFLYLLNEAGLTEEYSVLRSYIAPIGYALLLRPADKELFFTLDTGLAEIRASGSYEEIYMRWIVPDSATPDPQLVRRIWTIALSIALVAAAYAVFNLAMNRILKKRVQQKTMELHLRMEQLQHEGNIRHAMIEHASSGMVSFNQQYHILLMNRAAVQMSGLQDAHAVQDVRHLPIFGEILDRLPWNLFHEEAQNATISRPVTIDLGTASDKHCYRYNCYRSRNENEMSVLMTVEDITAEEQEKQEIFEKEKKQSLSRLVAGIAHEIKNPLMAIRTAASLLKAQGDDREVQEAFAKYVPGEVDRITNLIDGLINYARPVKGDREVLPVASVVRECLYFTQIAAKNIGITYETDMDETVQIYANRDKIKQSIINILINSMESIERKLQAHPEQPLSIQVVVAQDEYFAYVHIKDQGVGMHEKDIRFCTEPFFTTKTGGTGLGLALVQQFMEENGGKLQIESEPTYYARVTLKFRRCEKDETKNIDCR